MKTIITLLVILSYTAATAQKIAATFDKAINQKGISIETLDSLYTSALHTDSTKAAFKGQENKFIEGYTSLLKDLSSYLKKNNFVWGKPTRCFNRIYINKNGYIDYFLFNFKPSEIDPKKEKEFEILLGQFIRDYKFPLTNTTNFAQCSPVSYRD